MSKLEAGRELDALVAERVFGAVVDGERSSIDPDSADCWRETPHFSTDISAAWEVVEMVYAKWNGRVRATILRDDGGCYCKFVALTGHGIVGSAHADTAPLAICLAALESVK